MADFRCKGNGFLIVADRHYHTVQIIDHVPDFTGKGFTVNLIIIPFYCRIILQPGSVGKKFRPECIQFMINHQNLLLLRDDVIFPVTARPDFCHEGTIFVKEAECIAPRLSKTDYHGCKWSSYRTLASLDTDKIHRLTIHILL